jgi:hypothetical protein
MPPTNTRTIRRTRAADLRRAARAEAARRQEERDEAVAPAAQRQAVLGGSGAVLRDPNGAVIAEMPDGTMLREALRGPNGAVMRETGAGVLRAARVQRDGVAFIRVSPLAWMAANIERAERDGTEASFSRDHIAAARRLVMAWDEVGDGVGLGASDWGSLRGSRGTAPTEPAGHSSLVAQVAHRMEIEAAREWLGALWPCLSDIALRGMSPAAWSAKVGLNRQVGAGYLRAALDRLAEFYRAREKQPERKVRMRAVVVGARKSVDDPHRIMPIGSHCE